MSAHRADWNIGCSKHGTKGEPDCVECQRVLMELLSAKNVFVARGLKEDAATETEER